MDRTGFKRLAQIRLEDARALLQTQRWSAAYYLSGYAVECGLKACLLKHLGESDALFGDSKKLKRLSDCWTHDLETLLALAGLDTAFGQARGANPGLDARWVKVEGWNESSRYKVWQKTEAEDLFRAVTHDPDGVLQWIQSQW